MKWRNTQIIRFIVLVLIAAGLAGSGMGITYLRNFRHLARLEKTLKGVRAEAEQAQQKIQLVEAVTRELNTRLSVSELFEALHQYTPGDITLRAVDVSDEGVISVQGYARERVLVHEFQNNLVKSNLFPEVSLKFATKRTLYQQEMTDFKIVARLGPEREVSHVR